MALVLLCLFAVLIWARYRWVKLRPEFFPVDKTSGGVRQDALRAARVADSVVKRAKTVLEQESTPEATVAAGALRIFEGASNDATAAFDALISKAHGSAEVGSLLLGSGGLYVYLVVVPDRHEHARLLRRYPFFASGWRQHAEMVRASLLASGDFVGMAAILVFLSPEGRDCVLQLSCITADSMLIPQTLIEAEDLTASGVKAHTASFEFSLAA